MTETAQNLESSLREQVLEHIFVADLLRCLWCNQIYNVEILRGEVDRGGYDLVVECGGIVRHIQFKASHKDASTRRVDINLNLAGKSSGCVIWIWFDPGTMALGPFRWFGAEPGEPLPPLGDRIAKHSKGNAEGIKTQRSNSRTLNKGQFTVLADMEGVIRALFGIRIRNEVIRRNDDQPPLDKP